MIPTEEQKARQQLDIENASIISQHFGCTYALGGIIARKLQGIHAEYPIDALNMVMNKYPDRYTSLRCKMMHAPRYELYEPELKFTDIDMFERAIEGAGNLGPTL